MQSYLNTALSRECSSLVGRLPSTHETLGSILSNTQRFSQAFVQPVTMETFMYGLTSSSCRTKRPQVSVQAKRFLYFQVIWEKSGYKNYFHNQEKYSKLKLELIIWTQHPGTTGKQVWGGLTRRGSGKSHEERGAHSTLLGSHSQKAARFSQEPANLVIRFLHTFQYFA